MQWSVYSGEASLCALFHRSRSPPLSHRTLDTYVTFHLKKKKKIKPPWAFLTGLQSRAQKYVHNFSVQFWIKKKKFFKNYLLIYSPPEFWTQTRSSQPAAEGPSETRKSGFPSFPGVPSRNWAARTSWTAGEWRFCFCTCSSPCAAECYPSPCL